MNILKTSSHLALAFCCLATPVSAYAQSEASENQPTSKVEDSLPPVIFS